MDLRTCVAPQGSFRYSVHRPAFNVENLRAAEAIGRLGKLEDGSQVNNRPNFPPQTVQEPGADWIFEIPNAFPFRGTTYIGKSWADRKAQDPSAIRLPAAAPVSVSRQLESYLFSLNLPLTLREGLFSALPRPLLLAAATTSTDPDDLMCLAQKSCRLLLNPKTGRPEGLVFHPTPHGPPKPVILDETLFEAVANNPYLPDDYKRVMVLMPGVQGGSEIVGDWTSADGKSHVFEYLRRNSYIPWGHFAANMAQDAVRYHSTDLTLEDVRGMRHLYYQRTFVRLAAEMGLDIPFKRQAGSGDELESLRRRILKRLPASAAAGGLFFDSTLWGWNLGFDYAPSGYRLHASHQQVHQQFALIPARLPVEGDKGPSADRAAYAGGDLIADFIQDYRRQTGRAFFEAYVQAVRSNRRMDGNLSGPSSLVVYEDQGVMLFVPKAQTSQWELQLLTLGPVGHVLEADRETRAGLDHAIWLAVRTLGALGARMITVIELSKRFRAPDTDQRLLYAFLPRLPESPGAFSEAQLRWINGHYPEDFAAACRAECAKL
jgi:hypothetical protein